MSPSFFYPKRSSGISTCRFAGGGVSRSSSVWVHCKFAVMFMFLDQTAEYVGKPSAVACSIMRLVATIQFGKSEDKMYTIGPVILWATGEMVCGFFVVCVPTLPKVLTESPLAGTLKRIISPRTNNANPNPKRTGQNSLRPEGSERRLVKGPRELSHAKVAGAYCQLDEESVSLHNLQNRGAVQNSRV